MPLEPVVIISILPPLVSIRELLLKPALLLEKLPPPVAIGALIVIPFPADKFKLKSALLYMESSLIAALISMLLSAFKVRVGVPGVVGTTIASWTVIFPSPPLPPPVVTVTFVPSPKVLVIWTVLTLALAPTGLKMGPDISGSVGRLEIVISLGSSNHVPGFPWGARASMRAPATSSPTFPDVSIRPPSPPSGPPRAASLPLTWVVSSDQIMICPPGPWCSALAWISELAST